MLCSQMGYPSTQGDFSVVFAGWQEMCRLHPHFFAWYNEPGSETDWRAIWVSFITKTMEKRGNCAGKMCRFVPTDLAIVAPTRLLARFSSASKRTLTISTC